ncbi:MAG: plant virulence effector HPE1-like domain-containing protein [Shinella sp.]|uniref:plant virulence effector HPE1-like domain-containing protein n=1 Tax=Shinella sp. TaxID=1870904 RepID=UPI003C76B339
MRILLPTIAVMLLAAPALAGSIQPVAGSSSGDSISTIRCTDCPTLKQKIKAATYHVDAIAPGTQKIEIREQDGERRIFRTEAWMGGSPVLFVSKAPAERVVAADADKPVDAVGVDAASQTSAVNADAGQQAEAATMAASREFDPEMFELRLN